MIIKIVLGARYKLRCHMYILILQKMSLLLCTRYYFFKLEDDPLKQFTYLELCIKV